MHNCTVSPAQHQTRNYKHISPIIPSSCLLLSPCWMKSVCACSRHKEHPMKCQWTQADAGMYARPLPPGQACSGGFHGGLVQPWWHPAPSGWPPASPSSGQSHAPARYELPRHCRVPEKTEPSRNGFTKRVPLWQGNNQSLNMSQMKASAGGHFISMKWFLTAAHCKVCILLYSYCSLSVLENKWH